MLIASVGAELEDQILFDASAVDTWRPQNGMFSRDAK